MEPNVTQLYAPPMPAAPPKRRRTVWALLALLVLSPLIGEVMSGSTPPLLAVQPFALIFLPTLYGISAVLIHEIVARRGLGWGNVLILGAAFGIYQEALIVQTWYNYMAPSSPTHSTGTFGVLAGTNWAWALNLTLYHAVISILTPMILLSVFFPVRSRLPWLRWWSIALLLAWMLLLCGALAINVATKQYAAEGYTGPPPIPYLAAVVLTLLAVVLGANLRFPVLQPNPARAAPRLWAVRFTCLGLVTLYSLLTEIIFPQLPLPAVIAMLVAALLFGLSVARVRSWSRRQGWGKRHWLAVATGILMYFVFVWGPFIEFGLHLPARTGMTAFNLLIFIALLLYDRRLKRRESPPLPAVPLPATVAPLP